MGTGASTLTREARRAAAHSRLGERLSSAKNSGIAMILSPTEGEHAGMGILVDQRHVITCAHVVNVAVGHEDTSQIEPGPESRVLVRFPLVGDRPEIVARITQWRAPGMFPRDDIALLTLETDAPESAGKAILADITGMQLDSDRLSVFGLSSDRWIGNNVDATFMGSTTAAWIQIDAVDNAGAFVEQGFSGAAVWNATHQVSVGMVVAKLVSPTEKIAYMIPAYDLAAVLPELSIERRDMSSSFAPTWTILAAVTFILVFGHFAVQRGAKSLQTFSLGGDNTLLAAFWGMHIVAALMPVLMWLLYRFSTGFRLHSWWQRVPAFGRLSLVPQPSTGRLSALATILLFVALPFAAQANFYSHFLDGKVFVNPSHFACSFEDLEHRGMTCDRHEQLCWFDNPQKKALVRTCKPFVAAPYWNSAYRFGDSPKPMDWVTYYPFLQPFVIVLFTWIAFFFAVLALFNVVRDSPGSDWTRRN